MKRFLPALILLLTSCELLVDVDIPDDNANRVVTNAVQVPDSVWTVRLSRSNNILSPLRDNFFPIDFAEVAIQNPDGTIETLSLVKTGSGKFKGKSRPQPGLKYKLTINAKQLEYVESEMTMPALIAIEKIEFDSTQIEPRTSNQFFHDAYLPFTLTFSDPPGERNFYKVEVVAYKQVKYGQAGHEVIDTLAAGLNVDIKNAGIDSEGNVRQSFTDETFEGKTFNASLATSVWSFPNEKLLYIDVKLESLSYEYFTYEQSASLSRDAMGDPFAQPVQVYSNMSNGFGLFTGGSYSVRRYYTPEEP
jgi:hypothetical protein